ncbi:BPI fold-containing family A member 2-like [Mesocricetus auratus]|uniref:BPI fold-containing family A member 2-like n=1 Tax=Mesocricetus auratus TaxID=10036 RepID=A0ABM2X920_MESAU|nr:BPI fold-containing family A member 2-like [Mesocricetus auratus]
MFQLGSLVVLCILLTGTSASAFDDPQTMKLNPELLQKPADWPLAKKRIIETFDKLEPRLFKLFSSKNVLRLQNNEIRILDLQVGLSAYGRGIDLTMPFITNTSLFMPRIDLRGDYLIFFDLTTSLKIETIPETGLPIVTIGKCWSDPENITSFLLDRTSISAKILLDATSTILKLVLEEFMTNEICPLFKSFLSNLNVTLIQDLFSNIKRRQSPSSI